MYRWRELSPSQRAKLVAHRIRQGNPWHSPPHRAGHEESWFHIAAACYEHRPHIGRSIPRMDAFAEALLWTLEGYAQQVSAWCLLPNHYHVLAKAGNALALLHALGRLHGRSSHAWNGEEHLRGRQVFYRSFERAMRSERHFWATLNYVHHNPVHHGYVQRWTDWPWSSARDYLERIGREEAKRVWREYRLRDYGKGWDDPEI